jgi:hypothetical protein
MSHESETTNPAVSKMPAPRAVWSAPLLKAVPVGAAQGVTFSLASVDGTSSS